MCARRSVLQIQLELVVEDDGRAESREDQLLLKSQQIEGGAAVCRVEGSKRLGFLRAANQVVARAGSGSIEGYKGDIEFADFLLENKATLNRSFSVKLDWLDKISREAREEGLTPALSIQFVDRQGKPVRHGRWVMIPEDEFKEAFE